MASYNKIILALDLTSESQQLLGKAADLAKVFNSELHLVHVIEPLSFAYSGDVPLDLLPIENDLSAQAKAQLTEMQSGLDCPVKEIHILTGSTEDELHQLAEQLNADLIVVGSHGRHGIELLLGSTANGVLHGASCDVLAIRMQDH